MQREQIARGQRVMIDAGKDDAWAYVDGWTGYVDGFNNGAVQVSAKNEEGRPITLFVAPSQLRPLP